MNILNEGLKKFPNTSYIHKALFDLHCHNKDLTGMKQELECLREYANNKRIQVMFKMREALFYAYQKRSLTVIKNYVDRINGMTPESKNKLMQKVNIILNERCDEFLTPVT